MKTTTLLMVLLLISQITNAQTTDVNQLRARLDSSRATVLAMKNQLDTSQYTRIPNKDFDQIIDDKIFNRVLAIAGLIGSLLAFSGYALAKSYMESKVKNEGIKSKSELIDMFKKDNENFEKQVKLDYKNEIDKFRNEFEEYKKLVLEYDERERVESTRRERYMVKVRFYIITTRYQELAKLTDDGFIQQDDNLEKDLRDLLQDSSEIRYDEITTEIIYKLSSYLYNLGKSAKYDEVIQLLDEYEKKSPELVSGDAYTSLVLVHFNRYFNATLPKNRDKFLNSLITLEEKIPDYGHASALRLEVLMMEYKNASVEEKEKIKNQILTILNQALSSHRGLLAFETVDRLKLDLGGDAFAPNVNELYQLFPEQMKKIEEKAQAYLALQYKLTGRESYNRLLNQLFPVDDFSNSVSTNGELKETV